MDRDVDEQTVVQFHEYYATVEVNQNRKTTTRSSKHKNCHSYFITYR